MPIPVEDLVARMEWGARQGLAELILVAEGSRVTIRREPPATGIAAVRPPGHDTHTQPDAAAPDRATDSVAAPLAGLCHLSPEAGGAPFFAVGQAVEQGQTLCMIEAMKVMTSVAAPRGGTIAEVLVEDGASVDAGSPLVRLS